MECVVMFSILNNGIAILVSIKGPEYITHTLIYLQIYMSVFVCIEECTTYQNNK